MYIETPNIIYILCYTRHYILYNAYCCNQKCLFFIFMSTYYMMLYSSSLTFTMPSIMWGHRSHFLWRNMFYFLKMRSMQNNLNAFWFTM